MFLMVFIAECKAQNSAWNFHTMLSYDDPANLVLIEGADVITASNNFQQHLGLERVISVHEKLGIIVGGNAGFLRSYFWYQRLDGFSAGLELRGIRYFGAHTGLSISHHFNKYFYCQLNLRTGIVSVKPNASNPPEIIAPETSDDLFPIVYRRLPFSVNPDNKNHFFIKPDLAVGFKIPHLPISITMGIGRIFSPNELIQGEVELRQYILDQEYVSKYDFSDRLNALGFTFGVNYHINKSQSLE